mgnify:CR=1 FL=1
MKLSKTIKEIFNLDNKKIAFIVIGAGGTGSYVVDVINQLSASMTNIGFCFVADGDNVESSNLIRQRFIERDIGTNKAEVICSRYAFNKNVKFIPYPYFLRNAPLDKKDKSLTAFTNTIIANFKALNINISEFTFVVLDCVDNVASRKEIFEFFNSCIVDDDYPDKFNQTNILNKNDMYKICSSVIKSLKNTCFRDLIDIQNVLFIDMGTDFKTGQVHVCIDDYQLSTLIRLLLISRINHKLLTKSVYYDSDNAYSQFVASNFGTTKGLEDNKLVKNLFDIITDMDIFERMSLNNIKKLINRYGITVRFYSSAMTDPYETDNDFATIITKIDDSKKVADNCVMSLIIEKNYFNETSYPMLMAWVDKINKNTISEEAVSVCNSLSQQSIYINRIIADLFMFVWNEIMSDINVSEVIFNNGYTKTTKFERQTHDEKMTAILQKMK